jgi:hypothetical protein
MLKPIFLKLPLIGVVFLTVVGVGFAGLIIWRNTLEMEIQDRENLDDEGGQETAKEDRKIEFAIDEEPDGIEEEAEQDNLAGIPAIEEGIQRSRVLVSPSKRFVAYLDFVPGAGLTNVEGPQDAPYMVRTTGVVTIRDAQSSKEWQVTPENIARPLFQYIPEDAPVTFFVYPYFSRWVDDETEVWGTIELHDPADPSFPLQIEVFRIDVSDIKADPSKGKLSIQFFSIPHSGWPFAVGPKMVSADARMVLIEEINPEEDIVLGLYLYALTTRKKEKLLAYTEEQLNDQFGEGNYPRGVAYYIPHWFPGWDEMTSEQQAQLVRPLEPTWIDSRTITYLDFITREKVQVTIQ